MRVTKTAPSTSHVVTEDRFKLLAVPKRVSIRQFVSESGITFAPGRGFYQLTKPETIQTYKEIVAVRISDGTQVSGDKVRALLKIPKDAKKFKYTQVPDFMVFVQSTSYNRVLIPGTKFLYEVNTAARGVASPQKISITSHNETRGAPPPSTSAGSPIDLVFSFDTTGSMYSCLDEVRKNLQEMIDRILKDIPNIRISVFAHGDYCDSDTYITKFIDFTQDKNKLISFVKNVKATGGGDFPECYELVLKEVREKLSWAAGSQRALVMIGDAVSHAVEDYPSLKSRYGKAVKGTVDWRHEAEQLLNIGCRVYAVQCGYCGFGLDETTQFWQGLAYKTYGHHLSLSSFSNVFDFIMAIAYREQGAEQLEAYRQEVVKRTPGGGLNADLHALFDSLAGGDDAAAGPSSSSAKATSSKRKAPAASSATPPAKKSTTSTTLPARKPRTSTTKKPVKKATVTTKTSGRGRGSATSAKSKASAAKTGRGKPSRSAKTSTAVRGKSATSTRGKSLTTARGKPSTRGKHATKSTTANKATKKPVARKPTATKAKGKKPATRATVKGRKPATNKKGPGSSRKSARK